MCAKLKSHVVVFFTEVYCLLNAEPAKSVSVAQNLPGTRAAVMHT